eukprot:3630991-Prymnesium_polylepis.1
MAGALRRRRLRPLAADAGGLYGDFRDGQGWRAAVQADQPRGRGRHHRHALRPPGARPPTLRLRGGGRPTEARPPSPPPLTLRPHPAPSPCTLTLHPAP